MTDSGAAYSEATEVAFDDLHSEQMSEMMDQMEVTDFESALGIAVDEIERLEASQLDPARSSPYNTMLDHIMEIEEGSIESLVKWSKLTGNMEEWQQTNNEIVQTLDSEQQRLVAPIQDALLKAIDFQMRSQEIMAEVSVSMEYTGWIRSILSALIKSVKRVITQT